MVGRLAGAGDGNTAMICSLFDLVIFAIANEMQRCATELTNKKPAGGQECHLRTALKEASQAC